MASTREGDAVGFPSVGTAVVRDGCRVGSASAAPPSNGGGEEDEDIGLDDGTKVDGMAVGCLVGRRLGAMDGFPVVGMGDDEKGDIVVSPIG